jgi:hypothetical protein
MVTFGPSRSARSDRRCSQSEKEDIMRASVGDRIVIRGHRVGDPDRVCDVLEVRGVDGGSPYVVRWGDEGHESLFFPGPDAAVEHREHASK